MILLIRKVLTIACGYIGRQNVCEEAVVTNPCLLNRLTHCIKMYCGKRRGVSQHGCAVNFTIRYRYVI